MFFLLALTSGLFLGWSLGANDAANVFGTAVGSGMLKFRKAAWIASIFVVIGAVLQGQGGAITLTELSRIDALGGAFTVSLCAAVAVTAMTRKGLPVSTSQAIVGAILGWAFFTGKPADMSVLLKIAGTWVSGPLLGAIFSALLYMLIKRILIKSGIHIIILDSYIRFALIAVGAFGAYSLGANNIGNVMGVFIPSAPSIALDFGLFKLEGTQVLLLLGGLAIAVGIFTYSHKVMETVGNGILSLSPEAAIGVVLSQAFVLFIFSSSSLSQFMQSIGLPPIPLVPVSSTQVVVGAIIGIGLVKGSQEIQPVTLGKIMAGWILTPVMAGLLTFFSLFFIQNVFTIKVSQEITENRKLLDEQTLIAESVTHTFNLVLPSLLIISLGALSIVLLYGLRQKKLKLQAENEILQKENQLHLTRQKLNELENQSIQLENRMLASKIEFQQREITQMALNLAEQWNYLGELKGKIDTLRESTQDVNTATELRALSQMITQRMSFRKEMETFFSRAETAHQEFFHKLETLFPDLTEQEKRLATLIRINLSNKEIAALLNITPKSVETARYRLRKRLNLSSSENLNHFFTNL
ncbi:MAG: hypothetical protein HPY80_04745 [Bacteroidales bacterium]|nr:hypothetical protein [Bacteroidales bacterium]NPV35961.1 hypothetical protein [Bacteroidales bacterium]